MMRAVLWGTDVREIGAGRVGSAVDSRRPKVIAACLPACALCATAGCQGAKCPAVPRARPSRCTDAQHLSRAPLWGGVDRPVGVSARVHPRADVRSTAARAKCPACSCSRVERAPLWRGGAGACIQDSRWARDACIPNAFSSARDACSSNAALSAPRGCIRNALPRASAKPLRPHRRGNGVRGDCGKRCVEPAVSSPLKVCTPSSFPRTRSVLPATKEQR